MGLNDFETYLSLLGKLLRLSDQQRKSLTDELRDHLESRTEDLVAAGVSPEAAVHQRSMNWGDVAGLAHQFLFRITFTEEETDHEMVTRNRSYRWNDGDVDYIWSE